MLAATLFSSILAACGSSTDKDGSAALPSQEPGQYGDTGTLTLPLVDKPTTITYMLPSNAKDLGPGNYRGYKPL